VKATFGKQKYKGSEMDEYEIYEIEYKKIRKENRKLLNSFRKYLGSKKLSSAHPEMAIF